MKDHTAEDLTINLGDKIKLWDGVNGGYRCTVEVERITSKFAFATLPSFRPSLPEQKIKIVRKCGAVWPDDTALFKAWGRSFVFIKEIQPPVIQFETPKPF